MQCAVPVARTLAFPHRAAEIASDLYVQNASLHATWEHLAPGFNGVTWWGARSHLRNLESDVVSAVVLDSAVAPHLLYGGGFAESRGVSFGKIFSSYNRWGIREDLLERLLQREIFKDFIPQIIDQVQAIYKSYSHLDSKRAWCFQLHHRARFHTGSMAWRLSFGAWPVLPVLDRQVLACAGGMPIATIAERRAESELLCKRFPVLAALPLDRNSHETRPLKLGLRHLLASYPLRGWRVFHRFMLPKHKQKTERRYYYRIYDFNSPGWMAVRNAAEPYRARTFEFFDKNVLQELLPGPNVSVGVQDGITDASGLKMLTGFFLWLKDHV
jgi:hypothetical protein